MFIGRKRTFDKEVLKLVRDNFDRDKVCEVCGCIIKASMAVKGESIIKNYCTWKYQPETNKFRYEEEKEYLFTPYYCKVHAPKKEEKAEKPPASFIPSPSIDIRNTNSYKAKISGKIYFSKFEIKDYSQDFPSCNSTAMESWERPECRYCIHYDASEFEKWKEEREKVGKGGCVEPYVVSCRYIQKLLERGD
jgi:hypothetical protein